MQYTKIYGCPVLFLQDILLFDLTNSWLYDYEENTNEKHGWDVFWYCKTVLDVSHKTNRQCQN